ncbi:MAG: hypothetical protein GY822_15540 [Deltaproteobacteria bacterium]|nr:hypothetical protein [Deltaproteobacteria bacterium]
MFPGLLPFLHRHRRLLFGGLPALFVAVVVLSDLRIGFHATERITDDVNEVIPVEVGLVLGTTPGKKSNPNQFFSLRMDSAAALFHAGKVRALLVSGANTSRHYNETKAMEDALVARGVPRLAITRDEAGLRTLDSIIRAKKIFGLKEVVVVSQRFHLERALFLADHHGLVTTGFATAGVDFRNHLGIRFREVLARVKANIDVVIDTPPRFLGNQEHVHIPPLKNDKSAAVEQKKRGTQPLTHLDDAQKSSAAER